MVSRQFVNYSIGSPGVSTHVEAVHTKNPGGEFFTGELANKLAEKTGASFLNSSVSRQLMDLNRPRDTLNYPAVDEYRQTLTDIFEQKSFTDGRGFLTVPILHLSFHGMKNKWGRSLEVGTGYGNYCDPAIKRWLSGKIEGLTTNAGIDDIFPGYTLKSVLRQGDIDGSSSFKGFGKKMNTIQIEISRDWRKNNKNLLVQFFTELIIDFQQYSHDILQARCPDFNHTEF